MRLPECSSCTNCKDARRVYDYTFDMEVNLYFCQINQGWHYPAIAKVCKNYQPHWEVKS